MEQYVHEFARFLRIHMNSITVGIVATFLMLVGSKINGFFKKMTRSIPFVGRFALFVVLCSAGYAFVSSQAARYFRYFLLSQRDWPLIGFVAGSFVLLAILAYRGKDV